MKNNINKPISSSINTSDFLFSYLVTHGRNSVDMDEINVRASLVGRNTLSIVSVAVDFASSIKDRFPASQVELLSFRPLTEEESTTFKEALVTDTSGVTHE